MAIGMHAHLQRTALGAIAGLLFFAGAATGEPQTASSDLAALKTRLAADEAQAKILQSAIARSPLADRPVQVAGLFGESDEEKAARLQKEQAQDSSIATLNQRVGDLEDTLRRLTGQMEQLDHRVSEFNDKIARMQKDFDYKLCTIAAQQLGATNATGDQSGLPCNGSQGASAQSPDSQASMPGNPVHLAPPPGILGTLPQNAVPQGAQSLPETHARFDAAMNLLARAQYDEARAAFRTFASSYPNDDLAPQALYWIGDIAYVQKDFVNAAQAFTEVLKKYPTSQRAPESMLKLGQSLLAMNQKKEGCLALGALAGKYPDATKTVTGQALATRRSAGCR